MDVKCGRWWEKAIREADSSFGNKVSEACREEEVIKQITEQTESKD
jgi:hypothetical protein